MSKRAQIREKRRKARQRQRLITILVISGGALILAAILIWPNIRPIGEFVIPDPVEHPMADGMAMGDPNAPVVIEEFSDFLCTFCQQFATQTEERLIEEYIATGKVYFVYKPYPLQQESFTPLEAGMCAAEQDKFWEYHDVLFANQEGHSAQAYAPRRLEAFAEALNLDVDQFNDCVRSNRFSGDVQASQVEGVNKGVSSTPTFFLNGRMIEGAQPFSFFQTEIDAEIASLEGR
jgi:protein-disulfide isomerase